MRLELHSYLSAGWCKDVQADAILKPTSGRLTEIPALPTLSEVHCLYVET